jgi:hypothetical protein
MGLFMLFFLYQLLVQLYILTGSFHVLARHLICYLLRGGVLWEDVVKDRNGEPERGE